MFHKKESHESDIIRANLTTFVEATKVNVVTLSDAINVLSESVDANTRGNEQIANSVTGVAEKAGEQLELVKDNLDLIESNDTNMQNIDVALTDIRTILNETVEESNNGIRRIEDLDRDMKAMSEDLGRINDILSEFNSEIERISEVGDFIVEISDQLRMLAFNASIEAARAGEAGRGFSVVANEMSTMSSKTRDGMQTINKILEEITESSGKVNDSIENCTDTYNRSNQTFASVSDAFHTITDSSRGIYDKLKEISGMFAVMSDNSGKSRMKAENLFEAAEAISEKTHEIAAVSEEVAAESARIGGNTENLDNMLTGIRHLLKQYNTSIVPTTKKSSRQIKILMMSMLDNDFWYGVRKGALYAGKELEDCHAVLEYVPLIPKERSLDEMVCDAVQYAIDRNFDGIVFPGFLGGANKYFKAAAAKGIRIMAYNCDCNKEIPRIACLRPDPLEPGILGAKAAERKVGGKGSVLMLTGDRSVGVNVERSSGFRNQLKTMKGLKVCDELTVPDDADGVYKIAKKGLDAHPEADIVFLTNGFPLAAAKAIRDAGRSRKTSLVCFDHNEEIFAEIKSGIICAAIGQDAFGQGHDPIIWLYNHIVAGEKLEEFIPCSLSVVDSSNVDSLVGV
ncbi:MAG: substrate-binding domain-containing protein [Lachnospiraceae bacterium]|nr:substrate-binding domain-containing protein [Lachnospiraceae bacterium]